MRAMFPPPAANEFHSLVDQFEYELQHKLNGADRFHAVEAQDVIKRYLKIADKKLESLK